MAFREDPMYILSPRSFHKSGKYGHSLFTALSKSWLYWAASHETYDCPKPYTEIYGNPTDRQTGGWTWFSIWDALLFIRRRMREKRRPVCRSECFIPSGDRSSAVHTLVQLITALNRTSKFIFSSFPVCGESKYNGDCWLFWTLLSHIKRQWIFSIHRYLREFLHLHISCVSHGETEISELNRPWKEMQRPYFELVSRTEKWPTRLGKVTS